MRIDVFEFIDDVLERIDKYRDDIDDKGTEIRQYFKDIFLDQPYLYSVSKRIKTNESLSEKILRQNYYLKYKTVDNVLENTSDIIGIRIQCRFIQDEEKIYNILKDYFVLESMEFKGYFYNPENERIILKLDDPQPQTQHNGFTIYRIDGKYLGDERIYNYELQIKSFVNVFWGDIEHEILYKNFSYMITEDFVREMLYSIKRSLEQVDAQLLAVHEYLYSLEGDPKDANTFQLKRVVSKLIHDVFSVGFKDTTGVLLDFRGSADLITDYLLAEAISREEEDIVGYFSKIMSKITNATINGFKYGEYLYIEDLSLLVSEPSRKIGSGVASIVNADLKWNLILSIIFELSDYGKEKEYADFIDYLVFKISKAIDDALDEFRMCGDLRDSLRNKFLDASVDFICIHYDSDLFSDYNMELIKNTIVELLYEETSGSIYLEESDVDVEKFFKKLQREAEF